MKNPLHSSKSLSLNSNKIEISGVESYKAIIVDDEESARNILKRLLEINCPEIEVVAQSEDLEQGVANIKKHEPALVFLDIEMPNYAGYEISSFFEEMNFEIIFVTAYDSYAIKAFELSAVDYLLKPIDISKLVKAIDKFKQKAEVQTNALNFQVLMESLEQDQVKKIVVQVPGGQKAVEVKEVIAIEASESYSDIHTVDGSKYTYSKNLKHFETLLESNTNFIRTHKSWIINTDYLKSYSKSNFSIELEHGIKAKLSKYKKEEFEKAVVG